MAKAPAAASIVIKIGSLMLSTDGQEEFEEILSRLSEILPLSTPECLYQTHGSYWLHSK